MAYVGLSRHREGVSLHWSRDDMGSREGLDARLGRERLKDTSLDYAAGGEELSRAYAERRGLVPESEIILRERQAEAPAPRRRQVRRAQAGGRPNVAPDREPGDGEATLPKAPQPRQAEAPDARVAREMARLRARLVGCGANGAGWLAGAAAPGAGAGARRPGPGGEQDRAVAGRAGGAGADARAGAGPRAAGGDGRAGPRRGCRATRAAGAGGAGPGDGAGVGRAGARVRGGRHGVRLEGAARRSAPAWRRSRRS